eukprot:scaffold1129_cov164-Ochromonas_danica.AAC.6
MKPVRTNVSDYGDSNEHLLYLKIATEDDPPDDLLTSLQKAVKLRDKPKHLTKETAPPTLPNKFWSYWRIKIVIPTITQQSLTLRSLRNDRQRSSSASHERSRADHQLVH